MGQPIQYIGLLVIIKQQPIYIQFYSASHNILAPFKTVTEQKKVLSYMIKTGMMGKLMSFHLTVISLAQHFLWLLSFSVVLLVYIHLKSFLSLCSIVFTVFPTGT